MGKEFLKNLQAVVWLGSVVAGIVVFIYSSLATKANVDEARKSTLQYVDSKNEVAMNSIKDMKDDISEMKTLLKEFIQTTRRNK